MIVVRATGLVTVQDLGRPGRMHETIPPGGALIPSLLVAANRRAGNSDNAPALEIFGRLVVRADAPITVATDAFSRALSPGDEHSVQSDRHRAAYLAMSGGIDVPLILGGRGALVSAHLGRTLRTGDAFTFAAFRTDRTDAKREKGERELDQVRDMTAPVRVIRGPDTEAFENALPDGPYRVRPDSDRIGTRLSGPAVRWRDGFVARSRPAVRGAIEVPSDGQPIVFGPEHPTTAGYPLAGVIVHADLDRFFATTVGSEITFTFVT